MSMGRQQRAARTAHRLPRLTAFPSPPSIPYTIPLLPLIPTPILSFSASLPPVYSPRSKHVPLRPPAPAEAPPPFPWPSLFPRGLPPCEATTDRRGQSEAGCGAAKRSWGEPGQEVPK